MARGTFCTTTIDAVSQVVWDIKLIDTKLTHLLQSFAETRYEITDVALIGISRIKLIAIDEFATILDGHQFGVVWTRRLVVASIDALVLQPCRRGLNTVTLRILHQP